MEQNVPPELEAQAAPPPKVASPIEAAQDAEAELAKGDVAATEEKQGDTAPSESTKGVQTSPSEYAEEGGAKEEAPVEKEAVEEQGAATEEDTKDTGDQEQTTTPEDGEEEKSMEETEEVEAVSAVEDAVAEEKQEDPPMQDTEDVADDTPTPDADAGSDSAQKFAASEEQVESAENEVVGAETLEDPPTIVTPENVVPVNIVDESTPVEGDKLEMPPLSIDADAPTEPAMEERLPIHSAPVNNLVADEAVATPEVGLQLPQELEMPVASPAAAIDLLDAAAGMTDGEDGSEPLSTQAELEEFEQQKAENGEMSAEDGSEQEGEHATITAVAETTERTPLDANLEEVIERIRKKLPCETVEVLESGEILVLPKGWSTRQSKTNDGKTYYVSPYGHTQWLRPPMKTGVIYKWVHEIEVTFGPGRLGLNLKQIAGIPGTEFTDLQVHIAEIYKLPNGMASPAEIYNWSVKPEKRLAVNMRVTMMNGVSLAGYTYSEVLELLARMVRPVRIKFADISKGIVGRVEEEIPHEETEEGKEARAARVMQTSLRIEYFQILVSYELHKQVWASTKRHIHLQMLEMEKKCEVMETQVDGEQQHQESLEKEREHLIQEAETLKDMIKQLDQQAAGEIESPEVLRTAELVQRTGELEKEVTEIIAENDELQAARVNIEETLDNLQKELDEYGELDLDLNGQYEVKFFSPAFLGSMVTRGSIDTRAEDARERLLEKIKAQSLHLEEEIQMEEERAKFVESEIHQFQKQMDVAAEAVKREDEFISGERPPQMIFLENKIALLRKNLHETVVGIAKASNGGDQQQADNLSLRRADLKDDLKAALDEMRRMENELNVFFDVDQGKPIALERADSSVDTIDVDEAPHERVSETSRLQNKLARLQTQLHETVVQLAKAAGEKDEARKTELSKRRLQLKDEMKVVQDQFQLLTNGTLNVSKTRSNSHVRPSIAGPPTMQDMPRRSTGGSRASLGGGIRSSIGGSRASVGGGRASNGGNISSASVAQRVSERFDPSPPSHRSSSSASLGSLTQSHDSNSNQIPRDGSMPKMSGMLRKHPTHSNEKGTFGNMSLRGVRERWCNIEPDGYLRYYKREGDREPRGSIPLKHKSLEILHGKEVGKPNEFMICSPTHQTRMVAKTHEEMLRWVKMLELARAYFLEQHRGSMDGAYAQGSISSSFGSSADHSAGITSPESGDAELAYRNQRATLGF